MNGAVSIARIVDGVEARMVLDKLNETRRERAALACSSVRGSKERVEMRTPRERSGTTPALPQAVPQSSTLAA